MNLSFLFVIRKLYFPLIIGTFLCTPVIATPQSSIVYVKTRLDITLEQLSNQLDIPSDYLADLNDCDINRKFSNNEWVAIPAKSIDSIRFVVALDDSEIRRAQPNRSIFTKAGDNLAKIASRYEVPLKELTRLNPGLNPVTRLAVDTPIKLFKPLRARNTGLIFDKSLQELEREGTITIKDSQQVQRGEYSMPQRIVPNLSKLCSSGVLSKRECAKPNGVALEGRESTRKIKGICSELSTHQIEVDSSPNPSIQRLMALQRRNASRDTCNIEKAASDRRIQAERIAETRRNRVNWKFYGDVLIPWGLWFEPLAGKRVNGFLVSSLGTGLFGSFVENHGPIAAPHGISVSCSTGTFSINTNYNWPNAPRGWTEWAPPPKGSDWERIVIDLCSSVVNR